MSSDHPGAGGADAVVTVTAAIPVIPQPTGEPTSTGPDVGAMVQDLLRQRADLPEGDPTRSLLRNRSIETGLPLARRLAAACRGRGEPLDDLYQVASLALVKAVDGYDPSRDTAFSSYAVPTIVGALKRHFRDSTWSMRVPRAIKDLALELAHASGALCQVLGRSPTLRELAASAGVPEADAAVAVNSWPVRYPSSLDAPASVGGEQRAPIIDDIGEVDPNFDKVADLHDLRRLLADLTLRQQRILVMRYFGNMSQAQIAARVGVSQMHVSRLLASTLAQLRTNLLADASIGTRP